MDHIDLLISASWVLPIAPIHTILTDAAIAIRDQRIIAVLPIELAQQTYQAEKTLHFPNHVLMPGLVNSHTHCAMNLYRGLADDLPLMPWLQQHIWPAEQAALSAESIRIGVKLAIAELLRGGVTCFSDMYFFPNVTAEAVIDTGIRGMIAHTIMNVPTGWAEDEDSYIRQARAAHEQRPQHDRVHWSIGPHATYTNSDNSLRAAKALSDEWGFPITMHVHETMTEIEQERTQRGKRPLERLADLGLLNDRFIAVHAVHLNDEDIALLQRHHCHVVHCPESNLKLASGMAPISTLEQAGINIALGTDGAASNNDLDMFGEMRTAAYLAKGVTQDPTTLPAKTVLAMATLNGAKALGLDDQIGSLEPGKYADIISVDLSHYFTQPLYNPISPLVYAANRLQVANVWVAGQPVVVDGELQTIDVATILSEAATWLERIKPFQAHPIDLEITL